MNKLGVLTTFVVASIPAFGGNTAIPSTLANRTDYIVFDGNSFPSANLICPSGADGCGGGFQASISTAKNAAATTATVWCVDYQLNVGTDSQYSTDITTLNNITSPEDQNVRYGNLDSVETPTQTGWANALGGAGSANWLVSAPTTVDGGTQNTAAYRYTLAAALVSQYIDTSNTVDPTNLNGSSSQNLAIQEAIWFLTYNNDYNSAPWAPFNLPAANAAAGQVNNYAYWVDWALKTLNNNPSFVDTTKWAVISGPADASTGALLNPANNSYQTFLVQVVPEPAYYLLLALGLGATLFAARRRRSDTAQQIQ